MSAPVAILHLLRFDQAPAAGPELARPVRRDGAVEPGTVLYEGCAALEDVQAYPDVQRGKDYAEYTSVAALEATAKAIRGLPVILGEHDPKTGNRLHPGQAKGALELVKADNGDRFPKVGMVMDAEVRTLDDGRHWLWVLVSIFDAEAIGLIDSGEADSLSLAYKPVLDETPGTFRGTPYTAVQTDRAAINHLLLTNRGRGGPLCGLRADALGESSMTPEQIEAIKAAVKAALSEAKVADEARWISDESAMAMVKAMARVKGDEEPNPAPAPVVGDADTTVPKADFDALQARCDAAEKKVAELTAAAETAQVKADAAPWVDAVKRDGLTVEGFDPAAPSRAGIQAVERVYAQRALRGDAASARSPLDLPAAPPASDDTDRPATSTRYARFS